MSARREQLDVSRMTCGHRKTSVASDQRDAESLSERDEGGVVGGQVVAELPDSVALSSVRIADHGKLTEIPMSVGGSVIAQLAAGVQPAKGVQNLYIDQMGRVQI